MIIFQYPIFCFSKMKRLLIFWFISLSTFFSILAVEPTWRIDLGSVFDNREGDDKMYEDKTFFLITLAPEIGLRLGKTDRIAGGAVWTQPLENGVKDSRIIPTLYYRHDGEKWKFSMGLFPMTQLMEPLQGFLWADSLAYFQRNLRGALVQYQQPTGFFEAYIDWRAHQTDTRREAFNIMAHGQWRPKTGLVIGGLRALMNHFAKTRHADDSQSIVDNFLINPYLGIDLSKKTVLDSLQIRAGALLTVERFREYDGWKTPGGLWIDATFEWKFLGLRNSLYTGGKLFPLYSRFGTLLYQGESYYQSDFYDRADIYAKVYKTKAVDLEAQLNFNFARSNFMFYQRLILNINIGNI